MGGAYGPFHIISFSLAAFNSDPRNYPDSSDFLEVFKDLLGLLGRELIRGRGAICHDENGWKNDTTTKYEHPPAIA